MLTGSITNNFMFQLILPLDSGIILATSSSFPPMKTYQETANTLEDFIQSNGVPNALLSYNTCVYAIMDFQCEPHHPTSKLCRASDPRS